MRKVMDKTIHILMLLTSISLFLLTTFPRSNCQQDNEYTICSRPYQYYAADYTTVNISYPFWGQLYPIHYEEEEQNRPAYCGGGDSFKLNSSDDSIQIGSQNFGVMAIDTTTRTMRLVRSDLVGSFCSPEFNETYLSPTLFRYADSVFNVTIYYNCSSLPQYFYSKKQNFTCGHEHGVFPEDEYARPQTCARRVKVPVDVPRPYFVGGFGALKKALGIGFGVNYVVDHEQECTACLKSGGVCGSNQAAQAEHQFSCYCPDGSSGLDCSVHTNQDDFSLAVRECPYNKHFDSQIRKDFGRVKFQR